MVRTVCCESYKECGKRCSLCPHRPENQENLARYKEAVATGNFGGRLTAQTASVSAARGGNLSHDSR